MQNIVRFLQQKVYSVLARPDVRSRFVADAVDPVGSTPEEFIAVLQKDIAKWGKIIRDLGIREEVETR